MIRKLTFLDGEIVKNDDSAPSCGIDFCDYCGDCLKCYGNEECVKGGDHLWVVYKEKHDEQD